jgi:hypothetical protein
MGLSHDMFVLSPLSPLCETIFFEGFIALLIQYIFQIYPRRGKNPKKSLSEAQPKCPAVERT